MNSENIQTNYDMFILNDEQPRAPLNKIYTVKYYSLMITLIIIACAQRFEIDKLGEITEFQYILYILYLTAFGISCFSSYIGIQIKYEKGHRKLYFFSYLSILVFYILLLFPDQIKNNLIIQLTLRTLRFVLYLQVIIQVYGTWPQQFQRIFVEFYFTTQLSLLLITLFGSKDIFVYILITLIMINFVLIFKSIANFKSPETDSVFKDFLKLLFDKKPLIFTILIGLAEFLRVLLKNVIVDQEKTDQIDQQVIELTVTIIMIFVLIVYQSKFRYIDYQPTLIIFISVTLLLFVGLLLTILKWLQFMIYALEIVLYIMLIIVYIIQFTYTIPQYQQILLNIGIRNLDFASSYSLLTFGIIQVSNGLFFKEYFHQIKDKFIVIVIIIILMGTIIFIAIIFYLLLGFHQYFKKSNRSQVEENEFVIQVV